MDKKITIYDIAQKTNFSAVTVHRAISGKGRISEKTKTLILKTADELGYKANPAAQGLRRNQIKIGAVLFCPVDEYVNNIISGIEASAEELEKFNVFVNIKKIPYKNSKECLKETDNEINGFAQDGYNGIILFISSMSDEISELIPAVKNVREKSIQIATVANDILSEYSVLHVGIDAYKAGSMAAEMLEFSCKNKEVAIFTTSNTSPINSEYLKGFFDYSGSDTFSEIHIFEHFDDKHKIENAVNEMFSSYPDISGVYITSASSGYTCKCIERFYRPDMKIITTDILPETSELLKNKSANATIFQNPYKQGKDVLEYLYNFITTGKDNGKHLITPQIILSSNIDSYIF